MHRRLMCLTSHFCLQKHFQFSTSLKEIDKNSTVSENKINLTNGENKKDAQLKEIGGPKGPEPTRYGDWERKGRVSDF